MEPIHGPAYGLGARRLGRPITPHVRVDYARLRALRLSAGVSGTDVAQALGIRPCTWYAYERGESRPARQYLPIICDMLKCEPEDFVL